MKNLLSHALDWTSVKLTAFPLLGIFTGITWLQLFSAAGIAVSMAYNGIRIYKELKNNNGKNI